MRLLRPYLFDTPSRGHRAIRWTVPISVGRFWDTRTAPGVTHAGDTVLNLLTAGGYALDAEQGRAYADPAHLVFLRQGTRFATSCVPRPRTGLYLRLHPELWDEMHRGIGGSPDLRTVRIPPRRMVALHRLAATAIDLDEDEFVEACCALVEDLLAGRPGPIPGVDPAVDAVCRGLSANPGDRSTQDALAAAVGLSRFQLARRFRRNIGRTLFATREAIRMGIALDRVGRGQDLTEVALELGFCSHAHFSDRFGRFYGSPPSAFRATRI